MPINAHPDFLKAEGEYLLAETKEKRIQALKKMISLAPGHKGAENLRKNLKTRLARLKYTQEKIEKTKKGSRKQGIKKAEAQVALLGMPNTGKTTIFNRLTNQKKPTTQNPFTTLQPEPGTFYYEKTPIQIIDIPSIPHQDKGSVNTADTVLITINNLEQIPKTKKFLDKSKAKQIILFNKIDTLPESEKRKITSTLKSKYKLPFFLISRNSDKETIHQLKQQIWETFPIIRIYTKEPKKQASEKPLLLRKDSTVKDAAERILKGMSSKIKRTKIWGPSSKFSGQVTGLDHVLKDKDTIEFQTT